MQNLVLKPFKAKPVVHDSAALPTLRSKKSNRTLRALPTYTKHENSEIHRCKSAQRDLSCRVKAYAQPCRPYPEDAVMGSCFQCCWWCLAHQPPRLLCWCQMLGKCCALMATHWLSRFQRMASPTVALEAISKVGFPESVAA